MLNSSSLFYSCAFEHIFMNDQLVVIMRRLHGQLLIHGLDDFFVVALNLYLRAVKQSTLSADLLNMMYVIEPTSVRVLLAAFLSLDFTCSRSSHN